MRVSSELDVTRVSVPRACFGNPDRIRVNVRVTRTLGTSGVPTTLRAPSSSAPWVGYSPA